MILDAESWAAVGLSLRTSAAATLLMLPPGLAVAWLLARTRVPGRTAIAALVHVPLVVPPVVVGYLLLRLLGRAGPVGGWLHGTFGIDVAFTPLAAVIAATVMGFPLLVRSARTGIEAVDPGLEDAARTLGAGPLRVLATVTLPLALPGVAAGVVLGFARALGEFGATITVAGSIPGVTRTIPTAVHAASETPGGEGTAMRLVAVSVVIAIAATAASELLVRRARRRAEGAP